MMRTGQPGRQPLAVSPAAEMLFPGGQSTLPPGHGTDLSDFAGARRATVPGVAF